MSSKFDSQLHIFVFANFLDLGGRIFGSVGLSLVCLRENSCFASENYIFALIFMLNFNETSRIFDRAYRNNACELFWGSEFSRLTEKNETLKSSFTKIIFLDLQPIFLFLLHYYHR